MQLSTSVNLKQKQSLVMTPQLQQAIKLLQMTNLDLSQYLSDQSFENPFIEVEEENKTESNKDAEKDPKVEEAGETVDPSSPEKALEDDPTAHEDYDNRFDNNILDYGSSKISKSDNDWDTIANSVADNKMCLSEYVSKQIDFEFSKPKDRLIALAFSESLEESGWINKSLEDIAELTGSKIEEADRVLKKLQEFEPSGIFARSLSECLAIQCKETNVYSEDMQIMLENLILLSKGELKALAKKCKCSLERISELLKIIRSMNPKPGEIFDTNHQPISAPDLIVKRKGNGWSVDLNRSTLPSININENYASKVASRRNDNAAQDYASQAIASARWLKRALEQRNSTTLIISAEIIKKQQKFLEQGLDYLKPLSLKDIADSVGMHESTVSRVTTGLLLNTPRGSLPLKSLFSVTIDKTEGNEGASAAAVRNMIRKILDQEKPGKPLSDENIAKQISANGIKLARRTVAKYREMLNIPSSSERRRLAKISLI